MAQTLSISHVQLGAAEERSVVEVLRSGQLAQGPKVEELEHRFAKLSQQIKKLLMKRRSLPRTISRISKRLR